jgi:hypothetical protein
MCGVRICAEPELAARELFLHPYRHRQIAAGPEPYSLNLIAGQECRFSNYGGSERQRLRDVPYALREGGIAGNVELNVAASVSTIVSWGYALRKYMPERACLGN